MVREWTERQWRCFFSHVEDTGSCWVWVGSRSQLGYGQCHNQTYGSQLVHRALFMQVTGQSDLVIDHLCNNRACVNPEHLEWVNQSENIFRGKLTKRTDTHCGRGHERTPGNLSYDKTNNSWRCLTCRRADLRKHLARKGQANVQV